MPDEQSYLQAIEKIEGAFNAKYTEEQIVIFKEYLDGIPTHDWSGVVKEVICTCRRLPLIADFFSAHKELYTP